MANALQNDWWTFPEWFHEYRTFERMPGVSIDGKHVVSRFGLLLIGLKGRDNKGHVRVFDTRFLRLENEQSVTWFLRQFISLVKYYPKVIFTVASAGIIASIKTVMLMSFILQDEWYLNQRQYCKVVSTLCVMGMSRRFREMENKLHLMRQSSSLLAFHIHRMNFKQKWFGSKMNDPA